MKPGMLKDQCVPHMYRDMNNIVKNKPKHTVMASQFVDVNPYKTLADIDFSIVITCQPVNVSNVVCESDGEACHEASVLMKNGRNLTKGKKNLFTVSRIEYPFTRRPKWNNCPSKIGVSHSNDMQTHTVCQVADGDVHAFVSSVTAADSNDSDKYELEIQTKLKKSKIQVAKGAPKNEMCIQQNRPLFSFIPIYGLKGRVYDTKGNSVCKNILEK